MLLQSRTLSDAVHCCSRTIDQRLVLRGLVVDDLTVTITPKSFLATTNYVVAKENRLWRPGVV